MAWVRAAWQPTPAAAHFQAPCICHTARASRAEQLIRPAAAHPPSPSAHFAAITQYWFSATNTADTNKVISGYSVSVARGRLFLPGRFPLPLHAWCISAADTAPCTDARCAQAYRSVSLPYRPLPPA